METMDSKLARRTQARLDSVAQRAGQPDFRLDLVWLRQNSECNLLILTSGRTGARRKFERTRKHDCVLRLLINSVATRGILSPKSSGRFRDRCLNQHWPKMLRRAPLGELAHEHGFAEGTIYTWKSNFWTKSRGKVKAVSYCPGGVRGQDLYKRIN